MTEMLTAKGIQDLLQIDRSTVYRMAEAGHLPALKVGKQWRFPASQIDLWFKSQLVYSEPPSTRAVFNSQAPPAQSRGLAELLPSAWLQITQDTFAHLLGAMLVVTDLEGRPIAQPSHACGLFTAINQKPGTMQRMIKNWRALAETSDLTPRFSANHFGLLSARSLIVVGTELKGMVIADCIAPSEWPPSPDKVEAIAAEFDISSETFVRHVDEVFSLEKAGQDRILATLPQVAAIITQTIEGRKGLIGRLSAIAGLTQFAGT